MRKWSIGRKLFVTTGLLMALVACLAIAGLASLSRLQGHMEYAAGDMATKVQLADQIGATTQALFLAEKCAIINAWGGEDAQVTEWERKEENAAQEIVNFIGKARPLYHVVENQQRLDRIQSNLAAWQESYPAIHKLIGEGKVEEAERLSLAENRPHYDAIVKDAQGMQDRSVQEVREVRDAGADTYAQARWTVLGVVLLAVGIGLAAFWVIRGIVGSLKSTVSDLSTGGAQVASASAQIASGSQVLSQGASQQASSVQEISASMEEMAAMSQRNGENAAEAAAMMAETTAQVERSNMALEEMQASMSSIKESSEKVARINRTIDEIAFQTNILALNAAVEAARAGEAGKGFAVVAEEVRNLAQRAASAAKDTAALIEESIGSSTEGGQRLDHVASAIREITESANKVRQLVEEVNEASKQQVQGIRHVTTAISQVSTVTQTTAAGAEESAAAAEELTAQSSAVHDLVAVLAEMAGG